MRVKTKEESKYIDSKKKGRVKVYEKHLYKSISCCPAHTPFSLFLACKLCLPFCHHPIQPPSSPLQSPSSLLTTIYTYIYFLLELKVCLFSSYFVFYNGGEFLITAPNIYLVYCLSILVYAHLCFLFECVYSFVIRQELYKLGMFQI